MLNVLIRPATSQSSSYPIVLDGPRYSPYLLYIRVYLYLVLKGVLFNSYMYVRPIIHKFIADLKAYLNTFKSVMNISNKTGSVLVRLG